ncbi:uncharacterized protein LOC128231777 isoform X2 [Mya arenaria]|nr:uncharacterized protein LOC128231777 isoform X2 [Mya arenaria]
MEDELGLSKTSEWQSDSSFEEETMTTKEEVRLRERMPSPPEAFTAGYVGVPERMASPPDPYTANIYVRDPERIASPQDPYTAEYVRDPERIASPQDPYTAEYVRDPERIASPQDPYTAEYVRVPERIASPQDPYTAEYVRDPERIASPQDPYTAGYELIRERLPSPRDAYTAEQINSGLNSFSPEHSPNAHAYMISNHIPKRESFQEAMIAASTEHLRVDHATMSQIPCLRSPTGCYGNYSDNGISSDDSSPEGSELYELQNAHCQNTGEFIPCNDSNNNTTTSEAFQNYTYQAPYADPAQITNPYYGRCIPEDYQENVAHPQPYQYMEYDSDSSVEVPIDAAKRSTDHYVFSTKSVFEGYNIPKIEDLDSGKSFSKRGRPPTFLKLGHRDMGVRVDRTGCKPRGGAKNILLWKFLLEELQHSKTHIRWENEDEGTFKFVDTTETSRRWGEKKKKTDMNFEKLSRGIRHYYRDGLMSRKDGIRLVYKFHWDRVPVAYRPIRLRRTPCYSM